MKQVMGSKADRRNIRVGIIINYVGLFVNVLGALIVTPKILDYIGDYQYGLYTFAVSIASWLTIISGALSASFVRFSTIQESKDGETGVINTLYYKLLWILSGIAFLVGGGVVLGLYLGHVPISDYGWQDSETIYWLLGLSLINVCLSMPSALFTLYVTYKKKFIFGSCFAIALSLANFVGHFLIAFFTKNILWISLWNILMILLQWACKELYCRKHLGFSFQKASLKENSLLVKQIILFSGIIILNTIVDRINASVDNIILGFMGRAEDVTIYYLGTTLASYLMIMSTAISSTYVPTINELVVAGKDEEINALYLKVSRFQLIVLCCVAFGFVACGKPFVLLWVGPNRITVFFIAMALMLLDIVPLSINTSIEIQRARNKHLFRAIFYFGSALFNIALSVLFLFLFPDGYQVFACLAGTIIARIISHWIAMDIYNGVAMKLPIGRYFVDVGKYVGAGLAGAGAVYALAMIPGVAQIESNAINLLWRGSVFVVVFLAIVFAMNYKAAIRYFKNKTRRAQ